MRRDAGMGVDPGPWRRNSGGETLGDADRSGIDTGAARPSPFRSIGSRPPAHWTLPRQGERADIPETTASDDAVSVELRSRPD